VELHIVASEKSLGQFASEVDLMNAQVGKPVENPPSLNRRYVVPRAFLKTTSDPARVLGTVGDRVSK